MDENARIRGLHDLAGQLNVDVGGGAMSVVHELRGLMKPMVDHDSSMDTGGGFGSSDMWFTIGGIEYVMTVKPTAGTAERNKRLIRIWNSASEEFKALYREIEGWPPQ